MIVKVTERNFRKEVCECRRPVLVEFYAAWCPKCAMMEDILREFSLMYPGIKVCQVNTGEEPGLTDQYGIEKVPSFVAFDSGSPIGAAVGKVPGKVLAELFSSGK